MPDVVFTGGGSAGHVTPNVALIDEARARGWQVRYIGSGSGIERDIIEPLGIPYQSVSSGKLRRYFSWENFIDPFRLIWGILQSIFLLLADRPDAIFSKGGFVSVPVAVAAWLLRIPVISHESDVTPGLANRLIYPFCKLICLTFEETGRYLKGRRTEVTGTPVRKALMTGDRQRGLTYLGFDEARPVLLIFGGSLGAAAINRVVWEAVPSLVGDFQVVHVVGAGNENPDVAADGYLQKAFIGDEFGDVLAAADIVVSRAGANTLYELFQLRKPHLLIPLTRAASRGDQLVNAATFSGKGYSRVVQEEALNAESLVPAVHELYRDRESLVKAMSQVPVSESVDLILTRIEQYCP